MGGVCGLGETIVHRRRWGRCLLGEEIVLHNERRGEGVDLVVDLVLEGALLGGEAVAERLELVVVGGGGQLGLDARLEAGLGLGHELGAHVVPRAKVGGSDRHGQIREVPHLYLRLDLRLDLLRKREQPSALKNLAGRG